MAKLEEVEDAPPGVDTDLAPAPAPPVALAAAPTPVDNFTITWPTARCCKAAME